MEPPRNPIEAVRHPQPYPWYDRLARERPLYFDEALDLWVASGPAEVQQVLAHPGLRVRPPQEPVPRALAGGKAGEVFALLVRMNDGAFHERHRAWLVAQLSRWSGEVVAQAAGASALELWPRLDINQLLDAVAVRTMARLLEVPEPALDATCDLVRGFTRGIAAGASVEAVERAHAAADLLMAQGQAVGLEPALAANRIALMQQSLDATAGLLGNAILALQAGHDVPDASFVARVDRADPATHNTRRFAVEDLQVQGRRVRAEQGILVVLPPARLGFGHGRHHCPGESIALAIVAGVLQKLGGHPSFGSRTWQCAGYRPLPNIRIPVLRK